MRTALWMGYLVSQSMFEGTPIWDESTYEEFNKWANEYKAKTIKERKKDFVTIIEKNFRPIERLLGPDLGLEHNRDNDNVLGAFVWSTMKGLRRGDFQEDVDIDLDYLIANMWVIDFNHLIATVWTADRCIIAYTDRRGREHIATIRYDEITGIEAIAGKKILFHTQGDELVLYTTIGNIRFKMDWICDRDLSIKTVETFCAYAMELVMKYKQAKYAAQQGTAAPQYSQQTPPPKAPQGEAPQERSQWSAAQLDTAQRTAARLTAALQAPQAAPQPVPQAPQAAPPAGAGLSAETVEALKQLKGLLDAGILTQEEFDAKKKQLLGL